MRNINKVKKMNSKKKILSVFILVIFSFIGSALADNKANLKVSGVVCSFCAQGITKSFMATKKVANVEVDLDSQKVLLTFLEDEEMSDKEIEEVLLASGYNLLSINRE